ncbi:MAG: TIGR04211 family SH3 domain-containing protein [Thermodesulfobacteriota bacterium]|nr:TIGR04211 family SH3 domain-containing protein [Thermodesulfobacteriota bacterium]
MKIRWIIVGLTVVGVLSAAMACADMRYVTDQLVITLREGMGNNYRVIKTLRTDTGMEVLSEQGKYLHIRLSDGTEGYALGQYISKKTPKSVTIVQLRDEVAVLKEKLAAQNQVVTTAQEGAASLQQQFNEASQALNISEDLLETTKAELLDLQLKAENVVMIDEERQLVKKELGIAIEELERLRQDNDAMLKTAMIKWFLAGAGVLFFGWIAGKFSRKKKRGLGSF